MSPADRETERIRWHCRRGMLELDLVLNAFVERYLASLDATRLAAFRRLLERSDPALLDLVTGREEGQDQDERSLLALMRAQPCNQDGFQPVYS